MKKIVLTYAFISALLAAAALGNFPGRAQRPITPAQRAEAVNTLTDDELRIAFSRYAEQMRARSAYLRNYGESYTTPGSYLAGWYEGQFSGLQEAAVEAERFVP